MKPERFGIVLIYFIFFLSGASGLIYETVWLRMLIRILGNTVYATSIILAAFMAGLAIGSLWFGKISGKVRCPLRLYSFLELGIGVSAILFVVIVPHLTPLYKFIYSLASGQRFVLTCVQSLVLMALLLLPTSLMGGTLPLLTAFVSGRKDAACSRRIGYLYGSNTLGACIGVIAGGLFMIGEWGERETIYAGVITNIFVSIMAFLLSSSKGASVSSIDGIAIPPAKAIDGGAIPGPSLLPERNRSFIMVVYCISGFVAISYEIIWTRIFQIQLGTSIYAFSMMLACYLLGIGLGSLAGGAFFRKHLLTLQLFGWLQLFTALYSLAGMYMILRFTPIDFMKYHFALAGVFLMPLLVVTPLTFALGLMFPTLSAVYVEEKASGRDVGRLYSVNTIGCIAGSLVCGFLFIHMLGTRGSMILLAGLNSIIGILIFQTSKEKKTKLAVSLAVAAILVIAFTIPDPFIYILGKSFEQRFGKRTTDIDIYYHHESTVATTTAFGLKGMPYAKQLYINGVGMTTLCTETKLMAHIPCMLHPAPREILVICFGMGTALRSALSYKDATVDVVELVPETYDCFKYFHPDADAIRSDRRARLYVDDGRNFLLMRSRKYDVIILDPAPPLWSAGTVNLYTKEYFESCRSHLNPGGLMCLWIPPASFSEVRMIMKTYQSIFCDASVWRGPSFPGFYMVSSNWRSSGDTALFRRALGDQKIYEDINEWQNEPMTVKSFLNLPLLAPNMLELFTRGSRIVTDNNPYTEFPLLRSWSDTTVNYFLDAVWLSQWKMRHFPRD